MRDYPLTYLLSRFGAWVGGEHEDFFSAGSGRQDHPFRCAEFHLSGLEVCQEDDGLARKLLRRISLRYAREDRSGYAADIQLQREQLIGSFHRLRLGDPGDSQV